MLEKRFSHCWNVLSSFCFLCSLPHFLLSYLLTWIQVTGERARMCKGNPLYGWHPPLYGCHFPEPLERFLQLWQLCRSFLSYLSSWKGLWVGEKERMVNIKLVQSGRQKTNLPPGWAVFSISWPSLLPRLNSKRICFSPTSLMVILVTKGLISRILTRAACPTSLYMQFNRELNLSEVVVCIWGASRGQGGKNFREVSQGGFPCPFLPPFCWVYFSRLRGCGELWRWGLHFQFSHLCRRVQIPKP